MTFLNGGVYRYCVSSIRPTSPLVHASVNVFTRSRHSFPFHHLRSCQRTTVMTSPSVLQVVHLLYRLVLHHSNQGRIKLKYWFFYQKFPVQNCSKIFTKSKQKCLEPTIAARIQVQKLLDRRSIVG